MEINMNYTVSEIMLRLVRSEICGDELPDGLVASITPEILPKLYSLSKPQDIAHIVASALLSRGLVPDGEIKNAFTKEQMAAVFRHAQIRHELSRIYRALDAESLTYMPLKGSVIRQYYPRPEQRTSCDVDIYVKESELDAAAAVLTDKLGYKFHMRTPHDVAFYSQSKTHVELHFDLIENDERVRAMLEKVWDMSHTDSDSEYRRLMDNEMFVAYHIAHMAKHFVGGGCGVRPFLDLWIAKNKMGYDSAKTFELLREAGLDKFAEQSMLLADIWFSGAEHTDLTRTMEDYILGAAIYGNLENRIAILQARKGGRLGYILSRIFLPYSKLKKIYPRLEKFPILLPFYEVKRWFGYFIRRGTSRAKSEMKINNSISDEKVKGLVAMCNELGFDF